MFPLPSSILFVRPVSDAKLQYEAKNILGDICEVSSVEKGSDSLSGEQQGRGQVVPIRMSQRQDRETRQKIRAENQEIMRIRMDVTAAPWGRV